MTAIKRLLAVVFLCVGGVAHAQVDEFALKRLPEPAPRAPFAPADVRAYSGNTTTGLEWARPFADGTCCSMIGPVRWVSQAFSISANDTCNVRSVQAGWDGYLFIYRTPFNPVAQTVNFVAGDDDGAGGIGTSDIDGVALVGGVSYTIVTTGFELGNVGAFTNTISCPVATVTLGTPAPAAIDATGRSALIVLTMMLGMIGLGFGYLRRS